MTIVWSEHNVSDAVMLVTVTCTLWWRLAVIAETCSSNKEIQVHLVLFVTDRIEDWTCFSWLRLRVRVIHFYKITILLNCLPLHKPTFLSDVSNIKQHTNSSTPESHSVSVSYLFWEWSVPWISQDCIVIQFKKTQGWKCRRLEEMSDFNKGGEMCLRNRRELSCF
jgi:hypothetical protein